MSKGIRRAFVTQPCGAGRSSRNRLTSRSSSKGSTGTSNKTPTLQRFFLGLTGRRHAADGVAIAIGAQVANWALDDHFAPAN
jgi:hypothetical protein